MMVAPHKKLLRTPYNERRWFKAAKWLIVSFVFGLIALIASAYQLAGGPPWPIEPAITPQMPSAASPFNNPFDVANKSGLADVYDLSIKCRIVYLKSARLTVTKDFRGGLIFDSKGTNPILLAGSTPQQFTCPFREFLDRLGLGASALDEPTEARIALIARYRMPSWWLPSWFNPEHTTEVVYTLDTKTSPPRWSVPLN
jgi:hypothetical protein